MDTISLFVQLTKSKIYVSGYLCRTGHVIRVMWQESCDYLCFLSIFLTFDGLPVFFLSLQFKLSGCHAYSLFSDDVFIQRRCKAYFHTAFLVLNNWRECKTCSQLSVNQSYINLLSLWMNCEKKSFIIIYDL